MPSAFILPPYIKKEIKEINYFENINKNLNKNKNEKCFENEDNIIIKNKEISEFKFQIFENENEVFFEFLNLKDEFLLDFLIKKTAGFSGAEVVSVVQVYSFMYI
jgi:alanine dehydrogenase